MRDPKRIDPLLAKFRELWLNCPDSRFCQLVENITNTCPGGVSACIFNIEDTEFESKLDTLLGRMNKT